MAEQERLYQNIIDDLVYRFDGIFTKESVEDAVALGRRQLERTATVRDHLPVFVARLARERLVSAAQAEGRVAKPVPEILFVCVHNAGRSQLAAALADHMAAGRVHVRTAGSRPADAINPDVVTVLAERGIELTEAFPKPLHDDVVRAADVIVTMGCGDECPIFPGKRYDDWPVPDPAGQPLERVREIRDDIQSRVAQLLRELEV